MKLSDIFLTDGTLSPTMMLWLIYLAVVIGTVIYFTVNYQLGKIVSKLIELEATTPETAVSIEEAKLKTGFFTKMCLRSPMNYKDLLVAITADGKYYANMRYTDEPPTFKLLRAITRKRKSRIKDSENDKNTDSQNENTALESENDESSAEIGVNAESQILKKANVIDEENAADETTEQRARVAFNPFTAKYYIPKEVHDKAKGIYKSTKPNIPLIIAALIGLGVIIYFAGFLVDGIIDSFGNIFK